MSEILTEHLETLADSFRRDGLDGHHMVIRVTLDGIAALRAALADEKARHEEHLALLRECNAVCLCGCPPEEHENVDEGAEQCEHDDHVCLRTCPTIAKMFAEEKRAHEEARVCIQIVRERVEGILANWMRPPGGQQAGVPDKSINPDTCRAILRSLGPEQGSYTWEEFQRIEAERDSEKRWAKEYHDKWQAAERRAEEAEREIKRIAVIVANLSEEWGRVDTAARVAALGKDIARASLTSLAPETQGGEG